MSQSLAKGGTPTRLRTPQPGQDREKWLGTTAPGGYGHPRNTARVAETTNPRHKALLLIDFQQDFLAPSGRMPVDQGQVQPAIDAARLAVNEARHDGDLIVKIGNEFSPSDVIGNVFRHHAAMKGSPGAAWDGRIDPPEATYVSKWRSNAFCNPDLMALLDEAGVSHVRLAGLYAKACVGATAMGARKRGLSVQVIGDATVCSSDRSRQAALDKLGRAGIEVI